MNDTHTHTHTHTHTNVCAHTVLMLLLLLLLLLLPAIAIPRTAAAHSSQSVNLAPQPSLFVSPPAVPAVVVCRAGLSCCKSGAPPALPQFHQLRGPKGASRHRRAVMRRPCIWLSPRRASAPCWLGAVLSRPCCPDRAAPTVLPRPRSGGRAAPAAAAPCLGTVLPRRVSAPCCLGRRRRAGRP